MKEASKTDVKFEARLDDWESKKYKIITWIRNTSISLINMSFWHFEIAKEIWDFFSTRYALVDLAREYQLLTSLQQIQQSSGHSINEFCSQMSFLWDQLALSDA